MCRRSRTSYASRTHPFRLDLHIARGNETWGRSRCQPNRVQTLVRRFAVDRAQVHASLAAAQVWKVGGPGRTKTPLIELTSHQLGRQLGGQIDDGGINRERARADSGDAERRCSTDTLRVATNVENLQLEDLCFVAAFPGLVVTLRPWCLWKTEATLRTGAPSCGERISRPPQPSTRRELLLPIGTLLATGAGMALSFCAKGRTHTPALRKCHSWPAPQSASANRCSAIR